jgi:hypothetical protein
MKGTGTGNDAFSSDGSIPNAVLVGGTGSNTFTLSGRGTATVVGGPAGTSNILHINANVTLAPAGNGNFAMSGDISGTFSGITQLHFRTDSVNSGSPLGADATIGSDGDLYNGNYTSQGSPQIARITPSGTYTEFSNGLSTVPEFPMTVNRGDGNMWFTEYGASRVGYITPSGTINDGVYTANSNPPAYLPPTITADANNHLWFTNYQVSKVYELTQGSPNVWSLSGGTWGIAAGTGNYANYIYFIERDADMVGYINTLTDQVTTLAVGDPYGGPSFIAVDGNGLPWFTLKGAGAGSHQGIGHLDSSLQPQWYSLGGSPSHDAVSDVTASPDGNIWFFARNPSGTNDPFEIAINSFSGGTLQATPLPGITDLGNALLFDNQGNVWWASSDDSSYHRSVYVHFGVTVQYLNPSGVIVPNTLQAGGATGTVTVTAYDEYNHVVPYYTGTVAFYTSDPNSSGLPAAYTFTGSGAGKDNGSHTFPLKLFTVGAGTETGTATDNFSIISGHSVPVTILPGSAASFSVYQPSGSAPITAGASFPFAVQALDSWGNTATNYAGTVTFTSTDQGALVPPNYTFMPGDQGVHVFSATLFTSGSQTITATDTASMGILGSTGVTFPDAPLTLVLPDTGTVLAGQDGWQSGNGGPVPVLQGVIDGQSRPDPDAKNLDYAYHLLSLPPNPPSVTLTFDALAYSSTVNGHTLTASSEIGFGDGRLKWSQNTLPGETLNPGYPAWEFDATQLLNDPTAYVLLPQAVSALGFDQWVTMGIVIDETNLQVYGTYSFATANGQTISGQTKAFPVTAAEIANLDVYVMEDYHYPGGYPPFLGADYRNITIAGGGTVVGLYPGTSGAQLTPPNAIEGIPTGTITVASFQDLDPTGTAGNYTATISWGDGQTTSPATIVPNPNGTFSVQGSHTYQEEGRGLPFSVSISDNAGGASLSAAGTVNVADAPLALTLAGTSNNLEGQYGWSGPSGIIPLTAGVIDGQTDPGIGAQVSSNHPLPSFPADNSPVVLTADALAYSTTTGPGQVQSAQAGFYLTMPGSATGAGWLADTRGEFPYATWAFDARSLTGNLNDILPLPAAVAPWGFGHWVRLGVVVDRANLQVYGTYDFGSGSGQDISGQTAPIPITAAEAAAFNQVGVYEDYRNPTEYLGVKLDNLTVTAGSGYDVPLYPNDALGAVTPPTAVEGVPTGPVTVASFHDANPVGAPGDYSATIRWGDGQSSTGTVMQNPDGTFSVQGSHTYQEEAQSLPFSVSIFDAGGATLAANGTVNVADAPLDLAQPGTSTNLVGQYGWFNNSAGAVVPVAQGVIDGQIDTGTGVTEEAAHFVSLAANTLSTMTFDAFAYSQSGQGYTRSHYSSVWFGSSSQPQGVGWSVQNNPNDQAYPQWEFFANGLTGNSSDVFILPAAPSAFADGFDHWVSLRVVIDWQHLQVYGIYDFGSLNGQEITGQTPAFAVTTTQLASLDLVAVYQDYRSPTLYLGADFRNITISTGGQSAGLYPGSTGAQTTPPQAVQDVPTGVVTVASFSDEDFYGALGDYSATISWGDGQSSAGTIVHNPDGTFSVQGNHTYQQEAQGLSFGVQIQDLGGTTLSATSTVNVADAPLTLVQPGTGSNLVGQGGWVGTGNVPVVQGVIDGQINPGGGPLQYADHALSLPGSAPVTMTFDALAYSQSGQAHLRSSGSQIGLGSAGFNFLVNWTQDTNLTNYAYPAWIFDARPLTGNPTALVALPAAVSLLGFDHWVNLGIVIDRVNLQVYGVYDFGSANGQQITGQTPAIAVSAAQITGLDRAAVLEDYTYPTYYLGAEYRNITINTGGTAVGLYPGPSGAQLTPPQAVQGIPTGTVKVASFQDIDPNGVLGNYSATITWGDGQTSPGTIVDNGNGTFGVQGSHTYTQGALGLPFGVQIQDAGGASLSVSTMVNVAGAQLQNGNLVLVGTGGNDNFVLTPGGTTATANNMTVALNNPALGLNNYALGTFATTTGNVSINANNGAGNLAVTLNGTSLNDVFTVGTSTVALNTTLDTFNVSLNGTGSFTLNGLAGSNTLTGPNSNNTWQINSANGGTLGSVSFSSMQILTGGTANDTFRFSGPGSVGSAISGGGGFDTLDYSALPSNSPVTVNLATGSASRVNSGAANAVKNVHNVIGTPGIDTITGDNTGDVLSGDGGKDTLTGGTGNDTFIVASTQATGTVVTGGGGFDTLDGANITNLWTITGQGVGKLNTQVSFSAITNLVGGTGLDVFKFTGTGSVPGWINGNGAPTNQGDWLDYSALTASVTVNLQTSTAYGIGGAVTNIQNVHGSKGPNTLTGNAQGNILIGGAGADTIVGGSGPSILIGDKGADQIIGGSGGDILIGGYTTYDTMSTANELALMSILAEWQSGDSYATRFQDIDTGTGGGLNGTAKLNFGTTVFDDASANVLTAAVNPALLDWFFKGTKDKLNNFETGEHINNT